MEVRTLQYNQRDGWSGKFPAEMDSENTLILAFAAPDFINHPQPLDEVAKNFPNSKIVGCSTAGEILDGTINDESIAIAIARFDKTSIRIASAEITDNQQSFEAGKQVAQQLNDQSLSAIFILSDGLCVNGTDLAKGLNSIVSKHVPVTGGLAGDGSNFKKTWVIVDGKIRTNCIIAVGLYGDALQAAHASQGGWDIFGVERRITRSEGNVLYELDNQPALQLYKQYLGERADGLPATGLLFPMSIRTNIDDSKRLVRTILSVDEDNQSLTFAGDMPCNYLAQLMHANFDRLISSAGEAGQISTAMFDNQEELNSVPMLSIAISCVGRRLLLGERAEEEVESTLDNLPDKTSQLGFYSYGELSPYTKGDCDLHNQTMTLTTYYER